MDIFDLDQALIERYESFARSFSEIHAEEIREQASPAYADLRFWPEFLVTINSCFEACAPKAASVPHRSNGIHGGQNARA